MFVDFLSKNNLTGSDLWVEFDLIKYFTSFGEYLRVRKFRLDNDIIIDVSIILFAEKNIFLHNQPNKTVIFATQSSLRILSNSNTWIADGTFKSSVTGNTQLYSISGITNEENEKCCVSCCGIFHANINCFGNRFSENANNFNDSCANGNYQCTGWMAALKHVNVKQLNIENKNDENICDSNRDADSMFKTVTLINVST
uniref:Recep_L_domain domain-containing protein n=1 Tax=Strongyloides venezuelensis TaxID=75913 RepID=A0A0K0FEF2_STRVS